MLVGKGDKKSAMLRAPRKLALVASVSAALIGLLTTTALAAGGNITPPSTHFTAANSGNVTIKGTILGFPITVTCTASSLSGTTPASGLTLSLSGPPTFSSCRDNLGGTDTVTTSGAWGLVANSTGSALSLTVPNGGATFKSSFFSSCTITVGATTVTASYNNVNTATFTKVSIPTHGTGCTTSATGTLSATYVTSPNISVTP
jgi:hypothetical protein